MTKPSPDHRHNAEISAPHDICVTIQIVGRSGENDSRFSPLRFRCMPDDHAAACQLMEEFIRDWLPDVLLSEHDIEPLLLDAQETVGAPLPQTLVWIYRRLGLAGARLFRQDPIVHLGTLRPGDDGVVTFRREQQGCFEWGFVRDGGADPDVVIRTGTGSSSHGPWEPLGIPLSIHLLEGVLSEATLSEGKYAANLDPTPTAIDSLHSIDVLGFPPHPLGAPSAQSGNVIWYAFPDVLVRSDADTWLWALARTAADLDRLGAVIPGEWHPMG